MPYIKDYFTSIQSHQIITALRGMREALTQRADVTFLADARRKLTIHTKERNIFQLGQFQEDIFERAYRVGSPQHIFWINRVKPTTAFSTIDPRAIVLCVDAINYVDKNKEGWFFKLTVNPFFSKKHFAAVVNVADDYLSARTPIALRTKASQSEEAILG